MSGDVRSLEEVIAAAMREPFGYDSKSIAAAVREWCLAPQHIALAAVAVRSDFRVGPAASIARAALQAVMGDTPDDSKVT